MGCHFEDGLDVSSHIEGFQHFVTLIQDEVLNVLCLKVLTPDQSEDAAWCAYDDCGRVLLKLLDVLGHRLTAIQNVDRDLFRVHVLGESVVLLLDLECEFTGVA